MKNAEEYLENIIFEDKWPWTIEEEVIGIIKQAQLDAIEETCKFCAENAEVKYIFVSTGDYSGHDKYIVDKQSILDCADILKKELE